MEEVQTSAVWKFHWDCYRMGHVRGVFVATREEVEKAIGSEIYFGEILGKHSEIGGVLQEEDLTFISDAPEVVRVVKEYGLTSGYNPLAYIREDEDEETDEEEAT